jgi:5-methylcytosine-specific restriction endonuclease McrA
MYKQSGNPKVEELNKSVRDRSYNLSCLQAIKLPELNAKGKQKRLCAWCAVTELTHGNQKYCTTECSNSAMAWAYPQKEDALRYLLLRQDWKCLLCQYDYRPHLEEIIARDRRMLGPDFYDMEKLPWYYFKRLKSKVPRVHRPEVDHIVPIYKGGQSLGLDNHQAICYSCHKTKTGKDLSGKRNKYGTDRD